MSKKISVIGNPTDFHHNIRVVFNKENNSFDGLPDDWRVLLDEGVNRDTFNKALSMHKHIQSRNCNSYFTLLFFIIR